MASERLIVESLQVRKVCTCAWAKRIQRYWKRLGCGTCYVLLGKTNDFVLLIPVSRGNETIYGLMFNKKMKFSHIRNILWHEAGHIRGKISNDAVMKEFYADKWAIENALKMGYTKIVKEILLRCMYTSEENFTDFHKKAADMILKHFSKIGLRILSQ